jgi:hypothetical protein
MVFKYAKQHSGLSDCPPSSYQKIAADSFRFVASDPPTPNDFLPVALRPDHPPFDDDTLRCQSFGISLFASEASGREKFAKLRKNAPLIHKKVGTMIAGGKITPADGLASKAAKHGHFTLHEFASAALHTAFKVIGPL